MRQTFGGGGDSTRAAPVYPQDHSSRVPSRAAGREPALLAPSFGLGAMRVKEYPVLVRAVAIGVKHGLARARQQDTEPNDDTVMERIREAVLDEIRTAFEVDDTPAES
jgi:hypothetical protein